VKIACGWQGALEYYYSHMATGIETSVDAALAELLDGCGIGPLHAPIDIQTLAAKSVRLRLKMAEVRMGIDDQTLGGIQANLEKLRADLEAKHDSITAYNMFCRLGYEALEAGRPKPTIAE